MAFVQVLHKPQTPSGAVASTRRMTAELIASARWTTDLTASVLETEVFVAASSGVVTMSLRPQSEIEQDDTYYRVTIPHSDITYYCVVPDVGPVQLINILVDPETLTPVAPVLQSLYQPTAQKGQANGYASLDSAGTVPTSQLPAGSGGDAVPPTRTVLGTAGRIIGGGDLSANRTFDLHADVVAALGDAVSATQPGDLASVAISGAYADLTGKPTIPDGRNVLAARYGCLAISADPDSINADTPFIGMTSGRLYGFRMAVQQGAPITSVRLPIKAAAAGAGQVHFGVYQADLSQLGTTGDVAATLSGAVAESWVTLPLIAGAVATGGYLWVSPLSTMVTGAQIGFVNVPAFAELGWALNTSGTKNAVQLDGVVALPATLNPAGMNNYLDAVIGVA